MHRSRSLLLSLLIGAAVAGCSGEPVTGSAAGVLLSDAQRTAVAQKLVSTASVTGEGMMAATFAAAAIIAGAEVRPVSATSGTSAALAARASRTVGGDAPRSGPAARAAVGTDYYAVATQITEGGSPDVTSIVAAWRMDAQGTPSDFVLTLAAGGGTGSFAGADQETAPTAFALLYQAPSAIWVASQGTTTLNRTSTERACRDIDQRLAAAGFTGTCKLARFAGAIDVQQSVAASTAGNAAQGSATFNFAEATIGGVVIDITGTTAAGVATRTLR